MCTKFHEAALPDGGDMLVDRSSLCNFPSRLKLEAEAVLDEVLEAAEGASDGCVGERLIE